MKKDLFTKVAYPLKGEYRKENVVFDLYGIRTFNTLPLEIAQYVQAGAGYLNESIYNYNNEIVMAVISHVHALKYYSILGSSNDKDIDFFFRKYIEQTIKHIFSAYDKSFHILNRYYLLNFPNSPGLNGCIINYLKTNESSVGSKLQAIKDSIDSFNNNSLKIIRNDIEHNFSCLFTTYRIDTTNGQDTLVEDSHKISIQECEQLIVDLVGIIKEQKDLIDQLLEQLI